MKSYEASVKEFHHKYKHLVSDAPTIDIPHSVTELRKKLIMEELQEFVLAMAAKDIVEVADSLADLIYVVVGTAISYGIPIDRVFTEVHRSNMTKLVSEKEIGDKYGSINPKGLGYLPPDISGILFHPKKLTHFEVLYADINAKMPATPELKE